MNDLLWIWWEIWLDSNDLQGVLYASLIKIGDFPQGIFLPVVLNEDMGMKHEIWGCAMVKLHGAISIYFHLFPIWSGVVIPHENRG